MNHDSNYIESLATQLNLDTQTIQIALKISKEFNQNSQKIEFFDSYLSRASIFLAMRINPEKIKVSLYRLAKGVDETADFIAFLKDFLKSTNAANDILIEVDKFSFTASVFRKFQEIWGQLELNEQQGHFGVVGMIKEFAWMLVSLGRLMLITNPYDIVETACLMIGVLYFILTNLPSTVTYACPNSSLINYLASLLSGDEEQGTDSALTVLNLIQNLKKQEILRGNVDETENLEGIFSACHLNHNLQNLSKFYENESRSRIDDREFIQKHKASTPVKQLPKILRNKTLNYQTVNSKRLIAWDNDNEDISLKSQLESIKRLPPMSPFQMATPMSMAMEMSSWLRDITKKVSVDNLPTKLAEYLANTEIQISQKVNEYRNKLALFYDETQNCPDIIMEYMSSSKPNQKVEITISLYLKSIDGMLTNEEKRLTSRNFGVLLNNDSFHQTALACSIISVIFLHSLTHITFPQVLSFCQIAGFEFWKLINSFAQFDVKFPIPLKRHFKEIEVKILSELAWEQNSPIFQYLKEYIGEIHSPIPEALDESESSDITPKSPNNGIFSVFFRRVLSHSAHRVLELTEILGINDEIREHIWDILKIALSEHTEILLNRHLDTLILCCVYSVCKLHSPIEFKSLIEQYTGIYGDNQKIYKDIYQAGDIIRFYNKCFIPSFKVFLTGLNPIKPRIAALNPTSPLRANLPSPLQYYSPLGSPGMGCSPRSNYLTPRTRKLYAFNESSDIKPGIIPKSGRLISFDDENSTRAAQLEEIPENI
ncbi:unnamed protein product [Blepharisma stoltei]|uniref:Retinoblastoma-associated protein A-box domain-containing protein n=1 Tax=Blepharisma stoltei TaxID=1481888 RepID=A0AAU9IF56_9CILI|nr:unnamed protein product [Blepharisma stoltei]